MLRRASLAALLPVVLLSLSGAGAEAARDLRVDAAHQDAAPRVERRDDRPRLEAEPRPKGLRTIQGMDAATKLFEPVIRVLTADLHGSQCLVQRPGAEPIAIGIGDLINKGFFGAVYRAELSPAAREQLLPGFAGDAILKAPHSVRLPGRPRVGASVTEIRNEADNYATLGAQLGRIEQSPHFPKDPAWGRGRLPVVPILATLETQFGPMLLKPFAKGLSPEAIGRRGGLTEAMKASLGEILGFVQSAGDAKALATPTIDGQPAEKPTPIVLDARPANLMWMEAPEVLAAFGLSRPSFLLVEAGRTPFKIWLETTPSGFVQAMELAGARAP